MKTRTVTILALAAAGLLGPALPLAAQSPPTPQAPGQAVAAVDPTSAKTIDAGSDADKPDPNDSDAIVATVNDESISDYELRQRMALYIATSGLLQQQLKEEELKRIRGQILEQLETEKIQLQAAVKKHITVSPTEVDRQINRLMAENHLTIEQMRGILASAGTSEAALRAQITAQIAWQKVVQDEYAGRVNVSQEQVDAEMQRLAEGANKPHFLVSEIFLPVDNPEQDQKVRENAQNIENQIQMGAPFQVIAHQFSQNPSAAQGGQIGWVHDGQLAPELNAALEKMAPGGVSQPVRSVGGYYILQLQARQEPLGTKVAQAPTGPTTPDGTLELARLLLPLGPSPSKELVDQGMKAAGQIRAAYAGCEQLQKMASQIKGAVFMNLGAMKLSDLSPEIQKALAATHPGEMTTPLMSEAGIELIGRCDKKVQTQTAFTMPTRQQVEEALFEEQISALARRYMRDLRRDANVEVR